MYELHNTGYSQFRKEKWQLWWRDDNLLKEIGIFTSKNEAKRIVKLLNENNYKYIGDEDN